MDTSHSMKQSTQQICPWISKWQLYQNFSIKLYFIKNKYKEEIHALFTDFSFNEDLVANRKTTSIEVFLNLSLLSILIINETTENGIFGHSWNWNSTVELDVEPVMTDCNLGISFSFSGLGLTLIPIPIPIQQYVDPVGLNYNNKHRALLIVVAHLIVCTLTVRFN